MNETKELLRHGAEGFAPREDVVDSLIRRRARKERNRRIAAVALAIGLTLATFAGLIRTFGNVERPADEPTPSPVREDVFADVHGWIVYSRPSAHGGIWAVNPTGGGQPEERIQVTEDGEPLAWSHDGSKLLIEHWGRHNGRRWNGLFVLNADGTEARIAFGPTWGSGSAIDHGFFGGSFSPDGSRVVYAEQMETEQGDESSKIYTVDSDGGTPRFLRASQRVSPEFWDSVFSPDGQQIAYIAGWGDHDNGIWVMNADGSDARELADPAEIENPKRIIGWSNDGSRIFFDGCCELSSVWVVGADGSGLAPLFHNVVANPYLSPDGSRIAYQRFDPVTNTPVRALEIADLDGTHVQRFAYGEAGPWNPLPLMKSGDRLPTAAAGRPAPFVYAIVALGVVGVLVLAWRARRRTAAS